MKMCLAKLHIEVKNKIIEELKSINTERKEVTNEIKNIIDEIEKKSDISEYFFNLLPRQEQYRNFVNTLEVDQLVALINVFGYYMILITLINISVILVGDYLIERLNLDTRFPKLFKIIKLKQK